MRDPEFDDDFNIDLEVILEERKLFIFLGFAFFAIWVLSIMMLFIQN